MKATFADTSYYVALLNASDSCHQRAVEQTERLLGRIIVTGFVLTELGNALSGIKDRHLFGPLVRHLLSDPGTEVVPVSQSLFRQGLDLFVQRPDKEWSLVDCTSFAVMKQRRLTTALTTDHHFQQAGFRALLR